MVVVITGRFLLVCILIRAGIKLELSLDVNNGFGGRELLVPVILLLQTKRRPAQT